MLEHGRVSACAFCFSGAKDENGFAIVTDSLLDEIVGWVDLHPLGAPPKLVSRGGISVANEVDPERVRDRGRECVGLNGQLLFLSSFAQTVQ